MIEAFHDHFFLRFGTPGANLFLEKYVFQRSLVLFVVLLNLQSMID
jgi:hypothetical protein